MSKNIFEKVNVTEMSIDEIEKIIDECPNQMSMDELEKACDAANTEHGFINKLYGKCSNIVNELTGAWRRFPLILTLTYICGEIFSCYTFIVAAAKIFAPNGKISKSVTKKNFISTWLIGSTIVSILSAIATKIEMSNENK